MIDYTSKTTWRVLIFGKYSRTKVLEAICDDEWQALRKSLRGESLQHKFETLSSYIAQGGDESCRIRVTNYVNALSRGGLIK